MTYAEFLNNNKRTSREDGVATIVNVSFKDETVTCLNPSKKKFKLPIKILIAEMMNDICHINNASRLKNWKGWGSNDSCTEYPADYFMNPTKYIVTL